MGAPPDAALVHAMGERAMALVDDFNAQVLSTLVCQVMITSMAFGEPWRAISGSPHGCQVISTL